MSIKLFDVALPETSKSLLIQAVLGIRKNSKQTLYFFYSEFLLRANRNPYYKKVLNSAELSAIDGKGLHWSQLRLSRIGVLPQFYEQYCLNLPFILRILVFLIFFIVECVTTIISGFYNLVWKVDFRDKVNNELILGRDFSYNLLEIAQKKKWKTLIIGGNSAKSDIIRSQIAEKYPKLLLDIWARPSDSDLMKDTLNPNFAIAARTEGLVLNSDNLYEAFPDLYEARNHIKKIKPDLILVCLGGQSGKQEFFIDNLKADPAISFSLATGVGAALDHLGAGAEQVKPPSWLTQSGLEWVFRFINQPYRRLRIIDSIFTLWWWTTLAQFTVQAEYRRTIVNIIFREIPDKEGLEYLLVRRHMLPGDVGWSFVQGGVDKAEVLELAGLREIKEEVGLDNWDLKLIKDAEYINTEMFAISLIRFILLGAKYKGSKNYLNILEYTGAKPAKVNWENQAVKWFGEEKILKYLSKEKHEIWEKFIQENKFL